MLTMAVGQSDDFDPGTAIARRARPMPARSLAGAVAAGGHRSSPPSTPSIRRIVRVPCAPSSPASDSIGSTSAAEMSSAGGYLEDSVTLALFASDSVDFTSGIGAGHRDRPGRAPAAMPSRQALAATTRRPRLCIMLTDGLAAGIQRTLEALSRARCRTTCSHRRRSERQDRSAGGHPSSSATTTSSRTASPSAAPVRPVRVLVRRRDRAGARSARAAR